MTFSLDKVVPWGRSYTEYLAMFSLSKDDLSNKILGCSDGPASFNCHLTEKGGKIVSVDPLYEFKKIEIQKRIKETFSIVMEQSEQNKSEFNWDVISTIEELGKVRSLAMQEFLSDYEAGLKERRYIKGGLPILPFKDKSFDIALCS